MKKINEGLKKFDMVEFKRPVDAEELIEYCKENKYCPYFLTKYLLKEMTVVVCNYNWIFNPDIRFRFLKLLGAKLNKVILVIDECHNIVDVATSVNSYKLTPSALTTCVNDIQALKMPIKFRNLQKILTKTEGFESSEVDITIKEIYKREIREIESYITFRKDAVQAYINQKYFASRPLQDLRKIFENDPAIMAFDVMMLLGRDLATEPIFFDDLDGSIFQQTTQKDENFARQHIDPSLFWSLYVSRMFLTTRTYHGVYPGITGRGTISVLDQQRCLEGLHMLMDRGISGKGHSKDGLINELDIREVLIELGGGNIPTLSDGRTVLQWWKEGSSTGVRQSKSFDQRLESFNEKIKFKRENKIDSAKLFFIRYQKIAYDRFYNLAKSEASTYYLLSRLRSRGLGKFLSIPDSDLMRRIFPQQKILLDYI